MDGERDPSQGAKNRATARRTASEKKGGKMDGERAPSQGAKNRATARRRASEKRRENGRRAGPLTRREE